MIYLLIPYLAWISLFPEPFQQQFGLYTKYFLVSCLIGLAIQKKGVKFLFRRQDLALWLFLAGISAGLINAQDRAASIRTYFDIAIVLFCLYYLIKELVSTEKDFYILARTVCVLSAVVGVFALIEFASGRNFIYEYLAPNEYFYRYAHGAIRRPMSTQYNPTVLGTFLLGCLPFSFSLTGRKSRWRLLAIAAILISLIVIILTRSRGVFLGLIALFFFYLWHKKGAFASCLFLGLVSLFIILSSYIGSGQFSRFGFNRLLFGSGDSVFSGYRHQRIVMAVNMAKDYPLSGVGLNNFRQRFDQYYAEKRLITPEFKIADNMYLTILAETGIIGFLSFLIFIFALLKRSIKNLYAIQDKEKKDVLLIFIAAFIGLLVNMGAYELFWWRNQFALFCILCGMISSDLFKDEKRI